MRPICTANARAAVRRCCGAVSKILAACAISATLAGAALGHHEASHHVGEPRLEETTEFRNCCDERDCWKTSMELAGCTESTCAVRMFIGGAYKVILTPAWKVYKDFPTSEPVICTHIGASPILDEDGQHLKNDKCYFFPKPTGNAL